MATQEEDLIFRAKARMEWAMGFMVVRYMFIYQILGIMTKRCDPTMQTMGVRVMGHGHMELIYSPAFVMELSDAELTCVLYHEVLHLALHHCTHRRFDNHKLGNIAADLAVNELIPISASSCEFPRGEFQPILVSDFRKKDDFKDIQDKQTAEWYYNYLMKKIKDKKDALGDKGEGEGSMDNHDGWSEDEIADEKVRQKISEIDKGDKWGTVTGAVKELILAAQTQRIDWTKVLIKFFGNLSSPWREATRKRPNRRTGFMHPGYKSEHVDRHLVVADSSGSVDALLAGKFLDVINRMIDYVPIDFAICDCSITTPPAPFNRKHIQLEFTGRGGTSFQPIMDLVEERRYKSVVILTDGEAAECTQPHAKVVWVLPEGGKPPVDWGRVIHIS